MQKKDGLLKWMGLALLMGGAIGIVPAAAQAAYPEKPITIVVPFAAGGAADTLGRVLADKIGQKVGQPVIVENKPGAGTLIASNHVANAKPDGYTLLLAASSLGTIPSINKDVKYDPVESFVPITQVASVVHVISVNPDVPVSNVKELIEHLRKNKGKISYASLGTGSSTQLEAEMFKSMADVDMQDIPYKGSAPALTDLIAGRVQVMFDAWASTGPYAKAGKVKVLAVTTDKPSASIPDMPTISEAVPGFSAMPWLGLVAPKGTPAQVADVIYQAVHESVQQDDVKAKFKTLGLDVIASDPATFGQFIKKDVKTWSDVIRKANITVNP
ncbi:ABC transporter substrate-binding protein [Advenella sp. S44]|uniref:Bug family tripartite tricarboxylate transporter substrate binding protein n=1 Tax=Advenella sp. S44 TaxID=1982755 RepID=UPI000C29C61F|nr:tripartite tricarboxylate transporter substrate binding protein [Advenella sp. S44]PJX28243.1 ABC transporter substrate-binding protein [Advenella sp. S44]